MPNVTMRMHWGRLICLPIESRNRVSGLSLCGKGDVSGDRVKTRTSKSIQSCCCLARFKLGCHRPALNSFEFSDGLKDEFGFER